jgi:hypothetical protein
MIPLGHETWPPKISAQAVSLRLQQQLKSILSLDRCGPPIHVQNGRALRYGLHSVTAVLPILNDLLMRILQCEGIFRQGVSVLGLSSARQ